MRSQDQVRTSYLIGRLERMVYRALDDMLQGESFGVQAYTALTVLARRPGLSNAQLARRSLLTPQAMNQALSGLVDLGLVRRTPDETNRRVLRLELTEEGERLVEKYEGRIGAYEDELMGSLSNGQREQLNGILLTIVNDSRSR